MSTRVEDRKESREGLKAALSRQPVVAAVDLGASKVTCFIMKPDGVRRGDRTLTAAGVGYVQSRGVRGGAIINLDEASDAIAQAVERAENVAGVQVQGVTVATAGGQLASHRVSGRVSLGARPITDGDLVDGVRYMPGGDARTHSVVMRSESGTVRWVEAHHRLDKVSAWRAAHGG